MEFLVNDAAMIGVLALIASLITQLTKNNGLLAKMPTVLQVEVTAVALSVADYCAWCSATGDTVLPYLLAARVITGSIAALIAAYGWDRLHELVLRFKKGKGE